MNFCFFFVVVCAGVYQCIMCLCVRMCVYMHVCVNVVVSTCMYVCGHMDVFTHVRPHCVFEIITLHLEEQGCLRDYFIKIVLKII